LRSGGKRGDAGARDLCVLARLDAGDTDTPTVSPSTTIGTPPSSMPDSGADRNAVRPLLIMSS
jgi:hypothetical protein